MNTVHSGNRAASPHFCSTSPRACYSTALLQERTVCSKDRWVFYLSQKALSLSSDIWRIKSASILRFCIVMVRLLSKNSSWSFSLLYSLEHSAFFIEKALRFFDIVDFLLLSKSNEGTLTPSIAAQLLVQVGNELVAMPTDTNRWKVDAICVPVDGYARRTSMSLKSFFFQISYNWNSN